MSMRGKGEGSVYKRADGLWCAAIELPGPTRRRKVVTSKNKATIVKKLALLRSELADRGVLYTNSQTVEQWFTYWLDVAGKDVRPATIANYRSFATTWIIPTIGKTRLDKLGPAHVRKVTDAIMEKRTSTTAQKAHAIMSSAFAAAEREGRISRNPVKLTKAPRREVTNLETLTVAEASQLIATFGQSPDAFLWVTFLLTGARRGELLGLEWDRVSDVLDLSWQLQRHPADMQPPADYEYRRLTGGLFLTRPKSRAGWRIVPIVQPLQGILERWRALQPPNPYGLVFATADGRPIDPDWATHEWPNVLKTAGITKKVRIHDLRHTAVDLLYEAGVPEAVIMEIVGHSTRAMTRAYKARGNRPQLTDAMMKMSELLA